MEPDTIPAIPPNGRPFAPPGAPHNGAPNSVHGVGAGQNGTGGVDSDRCPRHNALRLRYNGRAWCRFCENNNVRSLGLFRIFLNLSQWGLALCLPLLIVSLILLAPTNRVDNPKTKRVEYSLTRDYYQALAFPAAFAAAGIATMVGRTALQLRRARTPDPDDDLTHWYEPLHALRDWFLLSLVVSIPYGLAVRYLPPADNLFLFLLIRIPMLFVLCGIGLLLLDLIKVITPGAILPTRDRMPALLFYGALMSLAFLWTQGFLSNLALHRSDRSLLIWSICLTSLFALTGIATYVTAQFLIAKSDRAQLPAPATIAMVGPSNVGKTVFVARAYHLLGSVLPGNFSLAPTESSRISLGPILRRLEQDREWPYPTDRREISDLPFVLKDGLEELVRFHWMDLPGAAFTAPDQYVEARRAFNLHLENTDAVAFLLDARDLLKVRDYGELSYGHIYREVAERLYLRLKEIGPGARPVPLAIILTQCDRVDPKDRPALEHRVRTLSNYWKHLARQAGLSAPPIQIFRTAAVLLPYSRDGMRNHMPLGSEPLPSLNCREPLLWLAAKVLRNQVGVLESASGFSLGNDIQRIVVRLEMLARPR